MAIEKSIEEKLRDLYSLQQIDSQIDEIQILKGELPMEVSDLEDEMIGLETRVNRLESQLQDLRQDVARHNNNIKEAEALIIRYEQQMDNVKNNREFDALTKEIELQRLEIQLSQKKINQANKGILAKDETLIAAKERMHSKAAELEAKKVELQQIIEKTEKEETDLSKKSEKARKLIEDRLLRAYDKTRKSYRNGLAVVTISRNACGGCFNTIPPQQQLEIAQRKKIIACEHCGRVLVDEMIAEPRVDAVELA
jgi:predicted  nucleic acid-binding Zn-ribbon protein